MQVVQWLLAHQLVVGAFVVSVIDFVWAIAPSLNSNGILHAIYSAIKKPPQA